MTATPTAVQVEGSTTWYHLNHCTRFPRERKEESLETDGGESEEETQTQDEKLQNVENKSNGTSDDHYILTASDTTSSSYKHQHPNLHTASSNYK